MLEIQFGRFLELKNSPISNASASEIVRWKQSVKVADCFCSLFVQNESGTYWIDLIARNAFSTAAVPTLTHDHCAFTLAVCDIILNPQSRSVKCTKKRMKRYVEKFLTDYAPEPLSRSGSSMQYSEEKMDEAFGVYE
ncbi:hypothetical protein C2G38_2038804 [Gigaspora rosea]|uniref:Uncharacterized protein n=1 Tax=Gigaspora rosea TaxID=44941 RepID=A0A397V473_9GLOM|nr:hypothetical protein C2G38_2038804 [Gigaspora rosea]